MAETRFERFMREQLDVIDNAGYQLALAIIKQDPDDPANENAQSLLSALIYGDKTPALSNPIIKEAIVIAEDVLIEAGCFERGQEPAPNDVDEEDILEWDMEYIGEIVDQVKSLLLEKGWAVCHPYRGGGEMETECFRCDDCPNHCDFKI